jgi:hypothetical protein
VHYITIFYNVLFAFNAQFTNLPAGSFGTVANKIIVAYYFGLDESFFKVSMYDRGSLWCLPPQVYGSSTHLLYPGGEKNCG